MIVVDVMLIFAAVVDIPKQSDDVSGVLAKDANWVAPALWRSEIRNVLLKYVRAKEGSVPGSWMRLDDAMAKMNAAEQVISTREFSGGESGEIFQIASDYDLTAYDAEYVALSRRLQVSLITLDRQILSAVPDEALKPSDFINQ